MEQEEAVGPAAVQAGAPAVVEEAVIELSAVVAAKVLEQAAAEVAEGQLL
jgi:hypothetical protein